MDKHPVDVAAQVFETELQIISRRKLAMCRILIRRIDSDIQWKVENYVLFDIWLINL